jgi:gamma-glutamyltranspeptidase / glutathione hydrolase
MVTTRPELRGTFGMVASTHWLASAVGMAVLEEGGNAFDAAVATGLTLQVVEPHLNGPGGEAPIVLYSAERDETVVVCGQGTAPNAATISHFRSLGLDLVPGTGLLAACVPGAFGAWMLLLREFGTLGLADVCKYAIGYAEDGFPVVPGITATVKLVADLFRQEWPASANLYLPGGAAPRPGELFRNRALAETYRRIVRESEQKSSDRDGQIEAAREAFYSGFVAEAIAGFVEREEATDSSGRRHRGVLSGDDLAAWQATLEPPVSFAYRGYEVCKTGPWGQGPVFLQQLALLAGFDLDSAPRESVEFVHTVVECAKLAFADREAWYGDPEFVDVPLEALLSPSYNDERRSLIDATASGELRPGAVDGRSPRLPASVPAVAPAPGVGEPTMASGASRSGDTCHLDVADSHGNLVSATPSGGWLHGSPVIPALGFCLGTRAQMFWLEEGLPNSLEPKKRPRTTLSPTLALREGEPYIAFGTPGGDQQDQWSLLFFLSHVHFDLDLQEAIDAPAFHTNHFPSSFYPRDARPKEVEVESRFGNDVVAELIERGHAVNVREGWSLGRLSAAARDRDGVLKAGANPRGVQGYAVGR